MRSRFRTALACAAAAVALAVALVMLGPVPSASAHGGPGKIQVLSRTQSPGQVIYKIKLFFVDDNDPGANASITAVGGLAGQQPVGPVAFTATPTEGEYTATVNFPVGGDWAVRFNAIEPPATLTEVAHVVAPATTTAEVTTAAPAPPATVGASLSGGESGSGSSALPWVFGGLVVIVIAVVIAMFSRKR